MKKTILLFFFVLINLVVIGQQKGVLIGTVTEESTGETLIAASIKRVDDLSQGTKTDLYGNFKIELDEGSYDFICSFLTLATDTFSVVIKAGDTTVRNIALSEISKLIETVVISTSRYEQKLEEQVVSLEILKPSALTNRNVTSVDAAIEQVGGVSIIDGDPQIRGGSGFTFGVGSRVAIVVDGMPLLSGDAGKPEWSYIPIENIEQIEIIKGVSSVLYGSSAMNGVIHIRTAYPRSKPKTIINYSVGQYSSPKAPAENWYGNSIPGFTNLNFMHSRIVKKRLDVVIGGNLNFDQGYIGPAPQEKFIPHDIKDLFGIEEAIPTYSNKDMLTMRGRINFNIRYRAKNNPRLSFGINGNGMYNKTNISFAWLDDSLGLYRSYPGALFMQTQKLFNVDPFLKYVSKNGMIHSINTRLFYSDNYISSNQSNSGTMYFGEYQLQKRFKAIDLNFIGGVMTNISTSFASLYAHSGQPRNQNNNVAGYIQLDKKFWQILNITGGVRYEYYKMNQMEAETMPIFRVGANLQLAKGTFVRASSGQGYRYPTITERYITTQAGMIGIFPNTELKSEKSRSFEIGVKQGYKIGKILGYIDIAGFYQHYENTIEFLFGSWDPSIALIGYKFLNTGESRVRGIDASIVGKTDETNNKFSTTFMLSYTYVDPKTLDPELVYAVDKSQEIYGVPAIPLTYNTTSMNNSGGMMKYRFNHMVKADVEFVIFKKVSIGASYRFYSKMKNIDKSTIAFEELTKNASNFFYPVKVVNYWDKHNGFHIFDARLSYKFNETHKLSIICNNLLNNDYSLRPMKIEAPRTTSIQYIVTL